MNRIKSDEININRKILMLEGKAKKLKRLHEIRKVMLSNGAYHNKNLDIQVMRLEDSNAPQKEIDLVIRSNKLCAKMAQEIMNEYEEILNEIEKLYN